MDKSYDTHLSDYTEPPAPPPVEAIAKETPLPPPVEATTEEAPLPPPEQLEPQPEPEPQREPQSQQHVQPQLEPQQPSQQQPQPSVAKTKQPSVSRQEVLRIIQSHLSKPKSSRRKEQDRVPQSVPDLAKSDPNVKFEKITVNQTDPDFVPVQDFTASSPSKKQSLQTPATKDETEAPASQARSTTTSRSRQKRRTKKHIKRKKKKLERILVDYAIAAEPYEKKDEAIRRLADSDIWKTLCHMVFRPIQTGK